MKSCWRLFFLSLLATLCVTPFRAEEQDKTTRDRLSVSLALPTIDERWGLLKTYGQILITLDENFLKEAEEDVLSWMTRKGGRFLHYVPKTSLLFLGDPALIEAAQKLPHVQSVSLYKTSAKMAKTWWPVLEALENHPADVLATTPLHELALSEGHPFLGQLFFDQKGPIDRLVIEVGFPLLHKTAAGSEDEDDNYRPAQAAAADWLIPLRERFGQDIDVEPFHRLLDIYSPPSTLPSLLDFLAEQRTVHWLQPKTRMQMHNWRASGIIQSGIAPPEESASIDSAIHPIWAAGIQGEDQIVGCGDSGVDVDSCFFHDPNVSISDNIHNEEGSSLTVRFFFESDTHRKIRYYGSASDFSDGDGHGTHVAGTLVGNPYRAHDTTAVANRGMAPEARLAFLDLGRESESNDSDSIYTPQELSTYYYPITYAKGVRIHSDSWGSSTAAYDHLAQEVDKFAYDHQNFLPVFAAGNYGQLSSRYLTTVTSPAVAKNCISVGATLTSNQPSSFANEDIEAYLIQIRISVPESDDEMRQYKILAAGFGKSWGSLIEQSSKDEIPLIQGIPETGCTTLSSAVRGKIVLVSRGGCQFVQKLMNAQAKGALGIIVANNANNGYFEMDRPDDTPDSELTIPIASVPSSVGRQLLEALNSKHQTTLHVMERTEPENSYDNIADFSSSGPTIDYRIKPDIVAPGRITSVWGDGSKHNAPGQCLLKTSSGTSMATPVVAGAAVLVRQYFIDGFYPSGKRNPKNTHEPSAALIKATLLGGAFPMNGYTEAGLPLESPPSPRQGFGRVYLETSIPVAGSPKWREGWRLQVIDGASLMTGQSHEYCVRALGGPIRITLVWTDPPALLSADSILVNDLDLSARSAGLKGRVLLGNGVQDRTNNVERVQVDDMPKGNLAIVVEAANVLAAYREQPYALVVQGHFNGILQSTHNPYQSEKPSPSEMCIITLAVIKSGPEGPTNSSRPEFTFTTKSGVLPVDGFECRLTDAEGTKEGSNAKLHDWKECSSPWKYNDLPDMAYTFRVRPKNEDVEETKEFIVDTKAPETLIEGDPIAEISSRETVQFHFSATDLTSVTFHCKLTLDGPKTDVQIAREKTKERDLRLDSWFRCTSPETFHGLTYGDWKFSVRAKDEAGNSNEEVTSRSWKIEFLPDRYYVRTIDAPLAVTSSPNATFEMRVMTGDVDGLPVALEGEEIECRLFPVDQYTSFDSCPLIAKFNDNRDGHFIFEARTRDPKGHDRESHTIVEFSIDSTAPDISFLERPDAYHGDSDVLLQFKSNEDVSKYECSMTRRAAAKRFMQCPGNDPGTVNYQLDDGWYTFQAKGQDLAGNNGYSEEITFNIDSLPPQILFWAPAQFATNQREVSFEFQVEDKGSGVVTENNTCYLLDEKTGERKEKPTGDCTSPMEFYLDEGRYLFTFVATDKAGQIAEKDLPIIVDFTPPSVKWKSTLSTNDVLPSFVVFRFEGSDEPKKIASLVTAFECKLERQGGAVTAPETQRVELAQNDRRRMLHLKQPVTSRHLMEGNATSVDDPVHISPVIQIRDGAVVVLDSWIDCEDPVVLTGMSSGKYAFSVRAIDHAGNTGEPTDTVLFTVDDTLPIPGEDGEDTSSTDVKISQSLVLVLSAASVLFVLCMCVIVGCWRQRSRRRRIEKRNARASQSSVPHHLRQQETTTSTTSSADPMLAVAIKASLQEQRYEEEHRKDVNEAVHAQTMQMAMQRSLEQYQYQRAVEESLYDS